MYKNIFFRVETTTDLFQKRIETKHSFLKQRPSKDATFKKSVNNILNLIEASTQTSSKFCWQSYSRFRNWKLSPNTSWYGSPGRFHVVKSDICEVAGWWIINKNLPVKFQTKSSETILWAKFYEMIGTNKSNFK